MSSSTLVLSNNSDLKVREDFCRFIRFTLLTHEEQLDILARVSLSDHVSYEIDSLASEGKITFFQAKEILAGRMNSLVLGPYTLTDEVGFGGFGKVYKGYHRLMGRTVAIKVINPNLVNDPDIRELFLREVMAVSKLQHPNLASVYYADEDKQALYYAMEYIDGPDLETWIEHHGPLPVLFAIQAMIQAANGLEYLAKQGMVHRDIKPANILLPSSNRKTGILASLSNEQPIVKIIDFGLARLRPRGTQNSLTIRQEAELVGTPRYIAPEQATDFHDVDIRSDIYSLGCTFYRVLSGEYAFDSDSTMHIIQMHHQSIAKPLTQMRTDIPIRLAQIIAKMMAKKPSDRYQNPQMLIEDLSNLYDNIIYSTQSLQTLNAPTTYSTLAVSTESISCELNTNQAPMSNWNSVLYAWNSWSTEFAKIICNNPSDNYESSHRTLVEILRGPVTQWNCLECTQTQLLEFIEPWVNSHIIASLDQRTQQQLIQFSNFVSHIIGPSRPKINQWRALLFALLLVASGIATYLLTR